MIRILIIGIALTFALTAHAAPQKRTVEEVLTQLHGFATVTISPHVSGLGLSSEEFRQGKRVNCAATIQNGGGGSVGSQRLPLPARPCFVASAPLVSIPPLPPSNDQR
jgi:hypothetical protein